MNKVTMLIVSVLGLIVVLMLVVSSITSPMSIRASGPIKQWSGMHLGNRPNADWNSTLSARIDGDKPGGIWPKAVVFLSNQLYDISLIRDGNCRINTDPVSWNPETRENFIGRPVLVDYLQRASQNGVRIIIRVYPSPGNFDAAHNLKVDPIPGIGYCDWNSYRPADDIADEMVAIHNYNLTYGEITEWGFEPANEPNTEWYSFDSPVEWPKPNSLQAWLDMKEYFNAIWLNVPSSVRALTPPMAQAAFAETKNVNDIDRPDPCPNMFLEDGESTGYGVMQDYYTSYNDGIDWHNYWRLGWENSGNCYFQAQHVSFFFPDWMKNVLASGRPGAITEADLFSYGYPPFQDPNQPLHDKDDSGGWAAANSLRKFFYNETSDRAQVLVAWLLNDWSADPNNHSPNPEHDWHEAYGWDDQAGDVERAWFAQWWPNFEFGDCYDLNNSGVVDIEDIQLIATAWRTTAYDFNGNDVVDVGDIQMIAAGWGERCS